MLLPACAGLFGSRTNLPADVESVESFETAAKGIRNAPQQRFIIDEIPSFPENVQGMTIDKNGVLYFSDTYLKLDSKSRIYTLNPPYTGTPLATEIASQSIAGIMWHNNELYVAYLNKNEVVIFDEALEFLVSYYVDSPLNFTTDGKFVYVVTYYGNLGVIKPNRIQMYIRDLQSPFDIHYSENQALYISEKGGEGVPGRVLEIGSGEEAMKTLIDSLQSPQGLATDLYNNLYIADTEADRILMVTSDGETILVTDQYDSPIGFAKTNTGEIVVNTNHNGGTLLLIQPRGFVE
jgi:DNA-binding beta-propeller fold protein YncE